MEKVEQVERRTADAAEKDGRAPPNPNPGRGDDAQGVGGEGFWVGGGRRPPKGMQWRRLTRDEEDALLNQEMSP